MAIEKLEIYQPLTVADYHAYVESLLPEEPTPELMNGGIVLAARPNYDHMYYAQELFATLREYVHDYGLAGKILTEFEVVLDHYSVVVPDLAFALTDNPACRFTAERLYGAPDFVCEISSPRTRRYDAHEKLLAYLRAGVREYWIVDPKREPGERFTLFERVETQAEIAAMSAIFQPIAGGPDQSRIFPGIAIAQGLL